MADQTAPTPPTALRSGVWYVAVQVEAGRRSGPLRITMTDDVDNGARVDRYVADIEEAAGVLRQWYRDLHGAREV